MTDDADFARIARWATGELDAVEADVTTFWIQQDPERIRLAEALTRITDVGSQWDARRAVMRWRGEVAPTSGNVTLAATRRPPIRSAERIRTVLIPRASSVRWPLRAAAIVTFAVGAATFLVSHRPPTAIVQVPIPAREVITKRGERATLDLADGSRVMLGPESHLVIPGRFNEANNARSRELALSGEAYFVVRHDSTRPFRVATATAITEDVGTSFVVNAYPEMRGTRVVVKEGSVALRRPGVADSGAPPESMAPLMVVMAGNLARLDESGRVRLVRKVNTASYLAWTQGSIVIDGARLSDAIPQLERWYDLDITLGDGALRERRLTGSFTNASEERMLEQLGVALGVRVTRTGRTVVLSMQPGVRPTGE